MHLKKITTVSALSIVLLAGCASTGPVEKVKPRAIDRSFVLPVGVASWSTIAVLGNLKTPTENLFIPPIPIPLFWERALTEDLTLVWNPLPLGLKDQISQSETDLWGVAFGIGAAGYGSVTGWIIEPTATLHNRTQLNSEWAIQSKVGGSYSLTTQDGISDGYSLSIGSGPLYQVSDTFAVNASIDVQTSKSTVVGSGGISEQTSDTTSTMLPLTVGGDWRLAPQWGFAASYSYFGLGSSDWSANLLVMNLTHYW